MTTETFSSAKISAAIYESGYKNYGVIETLTPEELSCGLWKEIRKSPRDFKVVNVYYDVDKREIPKIVKAAKDLADKKKLDLDRLLAQV